MFGPLLYVVILKNCTPLWRKAHFEVKMYKTPHVWTTFVRGNLEKLHAAVAKSTFASQNAQNMTCSEHFCKFRCQKNARHCGEKHIRKWKCTKHDVFGWKIARGCGEKHICKSKCTKHEVFGPLWYVLMLKNCTPLWWKAHLEVKMFKNCSLRSTFWRSDVEKLVR